MASAFVFPLPSAVEWSHRILRERIKPGDWVVDATAGNGHDTEFLATLVGPSGRVFAFDIQAAAIESTRSRLLTVGLLEQVTLFHAGHETMSANLPAEAHGRLAGVMMNLGYLPGQDKACITTASTTLQAIEVALQALTPDGVATIIVYPGHRGGDEEAEQVAAKLSALPADEWQVQHICAVNRRKPAPECWVVLKACAKLSQ
jgi:predicted methyltransferase